MFAENGDRRGGEEGGRISEGGGSDTGQIFHVHHQRHVAEATGGRVDVHVAPKQRLMVEGGNQQREVIIIDDLPLFIL